MSHIDTLPTVPFKPEPIEKLRARYKDAIAVTWLVHPAMKDVPAKHPEHVFNCEDGLRLIISKESYPQTTEDCIHFSVSVIPDSEADKKLKKMAGKSAEIIEYFTGRFKDIANREFDEIKLIGQSKGKNIPHFITFDIDD